MIAPDRSSSSPFFNNLPPSGQGVVIHSTRSGLSKNPNELEGTLSWFKNPSAQVSSHWVIDRDGTKVRVIPDNKQAWHAGIHNATHWGIELCQGVSADGFTEPQIAALAEVCKGYVGDFGIPSLHKMNGFIGHEETPQGKAAGKSDPGALFPWIGFLFLVNASTARKFLYGDEQAGLELRGKQQVTWNNNIEVDAIGDVAGEFPGEHWHRQGPDVNGVQQWFKVLP